MSIFSPAVQRLCSTQTLFGLLVFKQRVENHDKEFIHLDRSVFSLHICSFSVNESAVYYCNTSECIFMFMCMLYNHNMIVFFVCVQVMEVTATWRTGCGGEAWWPVSIVVSITWTSNTLWQHTCMLCATGLDTLLEHDAHTLLTQLLSYVARTNEHGDIWNLLPLQAFHSLRFPSHGMWKSTYRLGIT